MSTIEDGSISTRVSATAIIAPAIGAARTPKLLELGDLPAMQVIGAGKVDDDPVRRVGRDDEGEPLQHPQREPVERLSVRSGNRPLAR